MNKAIDFEKLKGDKLFSFDNEEDIDTYLKTLNLKNDYIDAIDYIEKIYRERMGSMRFSRGFTKRYSYTSFRIK